MSLAFDKYEVSFAKGLNQKADPRLVQAPELVRAVDVEFDETGGLRLRKPHASIGANILGGGTISDCRRCYDVGGELILFTKTGLYSWSSQQSVWVLRGTHLAVKTQEDPVFVTTGDQVEADRAELSGTVLYAWTDGGQVYAAAVDKETGAVITAPTAITSAVGRPRLVALSTKIMLFSITSGPDLVARAIDPTDPATGFAAAATNVVTSAGGFNSYYDVEKKPGADTAVFAARLNPTTSYVVGTLTAGGTLIDETKVRTCDGPIAVAVASGGEIQIARGNGTNIQGDLVDDALTDVHTGQALGSGTSTINQIAAAFADATTCHVFWTSNQATDNTAFDTDYNTVTTANSVGSAARLIYRLSIASRAFAYNSEVYVWLAFAGESSFSGASPSAFRAQLQNTYFLYRHDGHLVGKAATHRAAGFSSATGHLPGVALTSGSTVFSWCGGERRIVPVGDREVGQLGYSDRGPRDITFTFDSNEARRVAKLGATVYITGAEILQYDGSDLNECGYHLYPHYFGAIEVGAGNVEDGTYTLQKSWRWDNAKGERDRSTSATHGQVTIAGGPNGISTVNWTPLHVTHKDGVVAESWRTAKNVDRDAPFYLVTSQDPASTTNPNRYVENDPTASDLADLNDEFADSTLTTKESHPENEGVLESLAPPPATLIAASADRLFLAGVAGDPHTVHYSRQRGEGLVASFHDALRVHIPTTGGDITGLAFFERIPIVFRETAIYALDGSGHDNTGGGPNYEARQVAADVGAVSHESIAWTPRGLIFKSNKGWYLLTSPQLGATVYIGDKVSDYDSDTIHAVHVVESQHQVRIITSARALVWDYLADAWAEWSIADGLHATIWNGTYHYLATAAVKAEQSSYATADYGWDVEMLVHPGAIQGFSRCRRFLVLGEVRGSGTIRVRVGDYAENTYWDDKTWTISPTAAGSELNFQHGPSRQQQKAFRIRLTSHTTAGEKPKLSALSLELGLKPGVFRHLPAAQRQ